MNLYSNKPLSYFSRARTEIAPLLGDSSTPTRRVLEVGCAQGFTLDWLKKSGYCDWTAGVEPFAKLHDEVTSIDQFESLDIEAELPKIPLASLDLILCLDVLEHLHDPWRVVKQLDGFLKPGGRWIISVPNIRNYRVVFDLLFRGQFKYSEAGILDRTHLRFFTRSTLVELIESTGAKIEGIVDTEPKRWHKRLIAAVGMGDLLTKQFLLSATKP